LIRAGASELIFALIILELVSCLFLAGVVILTDGDIAVGILAGWLALAALRLTIHFLPRSRMTRYGLILLIVLMLFASVMPGEIEALPYFHQVLFIACVAALPQLWWEWHAERTGRKLKVLGLIGLFTSLPLGYFAWSIANIGIVKAQAWTVSNGDPYCIVIGAGGPIHGGYFQAIDGWSLSGWRMVSLRSSGGGSGDFHWQFHAILVTQDNRLLNWSYKSQRFESVSESTKKSLALQNLQKLSCR
jgi:hypothetical protein